jgi:hypothetical protein
MSLSHSNSAFDSRSFLNSQLPSFGAGELAVSRQAADRAIDQALRSVPLPDGLLTRLGKLAYTMSDEAADQVDWLGC